ncbi:DUF2271 domain-containing protein [Hyphomonas oceanitis]|uniref:DUF2271 domain-containing protein n=1 Tax=Hyphomonas oceanitis TaxID=81033 RepID=UPI0030027290
MRAILTLAGLAIISAPALADTMEVGIEIPRLNVAEYHRPYLAAWIANPDNTVAANLAVWYQQGRGAEGEGETWLKDLRQWWRRAGRDLDMPIDGVSGPTQAPGSHTLSFDADSPALSALEPGDYVLTVEAVREVGGREMVQIPFTWPAKGAAPTTVSGETELGAVTLTFVDDK